MKSTKLLCTTSLLMLAAAASPALAGGFYIQEQSVKGLGRAYSGEAADTGPDSLFWNPASIARVQGLETYGGEHTVLVESTVRNAGSTITRPGQPATGVGGDPRAFNPVLTGEVPNGGFGWRLNDRIAIGLTVTAPFDFVSKYASDSFTRYQAERSFLFDLDVQPTVAVRVTRYLDVGVGFDAQYTASTLTSALPNVSPLLPDGQNKLSGDGWDYGYTVGAQFHPTDRFTLGASYRSSIKHHLDGTVQITALQGTPFAQNVDTAAEANFKTPWIATVAARYRVLPRLTLNAQVQRVGWGEFDAIRVTYAGGGLVSPQNYNDVTTGAVGLDYEVNPRWTLRTGVEFDPTPTPDAGRTARVPDGDRYLIGVGTTVKATSRLSLDFAAAYIHFDQSRINSDASAFVGTPLAIAVNQQGTVDGAGAILSAGAHYRF